MSSSNSPKMNSTSSSSDSSFNISLNNEEKLSILVQKELQQMGALASNQPDLLVPGEQPATYATQSPVISSPNRESPRGGSSNQGSRNRLIQWMSDCCQDATYRSLSKSPHTESLSKSPHTLLTVAAKIYDAFSGKYSADQLTWDNSLALATACIALAAKSRKIRLRNLPTFQPGELEAWEKLILTKLDWQVSFVVPQDYLEPLHECMMEKTKSCSTNPEENPLQGAALCTQPPAGDNQSHTAGQKQSSSSATTLKDADLICSFCCHSAKTFSHPSRLLALCCLSIVTNQDVTEDTLGLLRLEPSPKKVRDLVTEIRELIEALYPLSREATPVKQLQNTTRDGSSVRRQLEKPTAEGATTNTYASVLKKTPPTSPFRITSASTPKARRPLGNVQESRKSLEVVSEQIRNLSIDDKENNDSAVGGLLGTPVKSLDGRSSKHSSPGTDSGASSGDSPPGVTTLETGHASTLQQIATPVELM